jgi:hypothetical protein
MYNTQRIREQKTVFGWISAAAPLVFVGGRIHRLRKNAPGCHSERSEESRVDPKCLRSGDFLHASSGMSFHRGAILGFSRKLFSRARFKSSRHLE